MVKRLVQWYLHRMGYVAVDEEELRSAEHTYFNDSQMARRLK